MNKKKLLKPIPKTSPKTIDGELKKLRKEINIQDKILLVTLKNRFKIVKKVALLKKKHNHPILQKSRWKTIIDERIKLGIKLKLNPDFTFSLMKLIHKESIRYQLSFQNKKEVQND
jgi:chorismate mutase